MIQLAQTLAEVVFLGLTLQQWGEIVLFLATLYFALTKRFEKLKKLEAEGKAVAGEQKLEAVIGGLEEARKLAPEGAELVAKKIKDKASELGVEETLKKAVLQVRATRALEKRDL